METWSILIMDEQWLPRAIKYSLQCLALFVLTVLGISFQCDCLWTPPVGPISGAKWHGTRVTGPCLSEFPAWRDPFPSCPVRQMRLKCCPNMTSLDCPAITMYMHVLNCSYVFPVFAQMGDRPWPANHPPATKRNDFPRTEGLASSIRASVPSLQSARGHQPPNQHTAGTKHVGDVELRLCEKMLLPHGWPHRLPSRFPTRNFDVNSCAHVTSSSEPISTHSSVGQCSRGKKDTIQLQVVTAWMHACVYTG